MVYCCFQLAPSYALRRRFVGPTTTAKRSMGKKTRLEMLNGTLTQTHRMIHHRDGAEDLRGLHHRHEIIARRDFRNLGEKADHGKQRQQQILVVLDGLANLEALFGDLLEDARCHQVAERRKEKIHLKPNQQQSECAASAGFHTQILIQISNAGRNILTSVKSTRCLRRNRSHGT
jgi:hypothetical protein